MNLNVHFHSLVLDGVYYLDDRKQLRFRRLPSPDDAEVARVTSCIARRIARLLERRGLGPRADPEEADTLRRDQPLLAELYAPSVQGRIAFGPRAGHRVAAFDAGTEGDSFALTAPRCAGVSGFSSRECLHSRPGTPPVGKSLPLCRTSRDSHGTTVGIT